MYQAGFHFQMHNDHCVGHGVLFVKTLSVYTAISSLSFLKFGRGKKKKKKEWRSLTLSSVFQDLFA